MTNSEDMIGFALAIIGILITLVIPIPLKDEYRLFVISAFIFIFIVVILSRFDSRLEVSSRKLEEFNKRFKTLEELNNIRLDIMELKRKVFK
ncbi:MAG: hypothetical protein U9Q73_00050 [Nanoarchaeota archaeon]|nr:hypothetical protein [Nanoarchaeota archaeon]